MSGNHSNRFRVCLLLSHVVAGWLSLSGGLRAEQRTLTSGAGGDGQMSIRSDQYGAFGPFSVDAPGFGKFDAETVSGLKDWQYVGALMLADDAVYRWLMDSDDGPGDFVNVFA